MTREKEFVESHLEKGDVVAAATVSQHDTSLSRRVGQIIFTYLDDFDK